MATNLIESVRASLRPETMRALEHGAGLSRDETAVASEVVVSTLLAGLESMSQQEGGATRLMGMLFRGGYVDAGALESLEVETADAWKERGQGILAAAFGNGLDVMANELSRVGHVEPGGALRMLAMLAPFVMATLGRRVREDELEWRGLRDLLAAEKTRIDRRVPEELAETIGLRPVVTTHTETPALAEVAWVPPRAAPSERRDRGWLWSAVVLGVVGAGLLTFWLVRRADLDETARREASEGLDKVAVAVVDKREAPTPARVFGALPAVTEAPAAADAAEDARNESRGSVAATERYAAEQEAYAAELGLRAAEERAYVAEREARTAEREALNAERRGEAAAADEANQAERAAVAAVAGEGAAARAEVAEALAGAGLAALSAAIVESSTTPQRFAVPELAFTEGAPAPGTGPALDELARLLRDNPDARLRIEALANATGGTTRDGTTAIGGTTADDDLARARALLIQNELARRAVAPGRFDAVASDRMYAPIGGGGAPTAAATNRQFDVVLLPS